ncbi:M15 family metallopeptidase [Pseudoduganella umbonata]|uniref:M15 family metallopeptidase n=1 Tax=Pseudoduganella umbonata TaxID=864828 RepID=A0A4P8HN24_9BURK|nr:M15 family metallopeptidase [Pseudoduganella umbonata]MBB3224823.1 peptidoglycan L-alanyl-D-glutamate endopeptidase CwlK [Pseudoduganella umbonata]QCP11127.1 M15 family metallopeptidase [Pseudoduganella umbonata]
MFLLSMLLLFVTACVAGWLLVFPAGRDLAGAALLRLGRDADRVRQGISMGGVQALLSAGRAAHAVLARAGRLVQRSPLLTVGCAALVLVPPLTALLLAVRTSLPSGATPAHAVNEQVAELLRGERLAAPPSLPPTVFTTAEVTLVRPQVASANRNWDLLDADFTQRLLLVFKVMRDQYGYEMVLLEGYRSPERQNRLADAGGHVTNARAFQSWHQFGLAGDCAFLRNGKVVISEKDPWAMRGYELYGQVAEAAGLTWGGRWKMMDFGHVELRGRRR